MKTSLPQSTHKKKKCPINKGLAFFVKSIGDCPKLIEKSQETIKNLEIKNKKSYKCPEVAELTAWVTETLTRHQNSLENIVNNEAENITTTLTLLDGFEKEVKKTTKPIDTLLDKVVVELQKNKHKDKNLRQTNKRSSNKKPLRYNTPNSPNSPKSTPNNLTLTLRKIALTLEKKCKLLRFFEEEIAERSETFSVTLSSYITHLTVVKHLINCSNSITPTISAPFLHKKLKSLKNPLL